MLCSSASKHAYTVCKDIKVRFFLDSFQAIVILHMLMFIVGCKLWGSADVSGNYLSTHVQLANDLYRQLLLACTYYTVL